MADRFEDEEFETSAPRARTGSIATMGQLLLQGYAMLADSCETCGVPLMRKPNSQEIICVNCNSTEEAETQAQPAPSTTARSLPNGIANHHYPAQSVTIVENGSLEDEDEDLEPAPAPLRERITPSTTGNSTLPAQTSARTTAGAAPAVDSSQALADKMLEGWALLAEHCPLCSTPFVRSRDGRIYCVACDLYAVKEGDVASGRGSGGGGGGGGAGAHPPGQQDIDVAGDINEPSSSIAPIHTETIVRNTINNVREEGSAAVRGNIVKAQNCIAARLARRAGALEKASSAEAATLLEEIQSCVQVLSGVKALLSG